MLANAERRGVISVCLSWLQERCGAAAAATGAKTGRTKRRCSQAPTSTTCGRYTGNIT